MPPTKLQATATVVIIGSSSRRSPDSRPWSRLLPKPSSGSRWPKPSTLKPERTLFLLALIFPLWSPAQKKNHTTQPRHLGIILTFPFLCFPHPSSQTLNLIHGPGFMPLPFVPTGIPGASVYITATTPWSPASAAGHPIFPLIITKTTIPKQNEPCPISSLAYRKKKKIQNPRQSEAPPSLVLTADFLL